MATTVRQATLDDLTSMVAVATEAQVDPNRSCAYLGDDAASIAADIADVVGETGGPWTDATWIAVDDGGQLAGWLLAKTDPDMSRVWWWGPIVVDLSDEDFAGAADLLFDTASAALPDFCEHELAVDSRSVSLVEFACRHGFGPNAASAVLTARPLDESAGSRDPDIRPIGKEHREPVSALHDQLFPATHTPGSKIIDVDPDHLRLVIEDVEDGRVIGYVATERQHDGSLYVDFLGVAPDQRGRGVGRRLVSEAMRRGAAAGATHAHLTVRTANAAARQLYRSLGFVEERVLVPYRRGFTLD